MTGHDKPINNTNSTTIWLQNARVIVGVLITLIGIIVTVAYYSFQIKTSAEKIEMNTSSIQKVEDKYHVLDKNIVELKGDIKNIAEKQQKIDEKIDRILERTRK